MRVIKFEADWCTNCKSMDRILDTVDIPYPLERVDVDKNPHLCIEWGVRGIPHMIVLDENNNIVHRFGGIVTKEKLEEALNLQ